MKEWTRELFYFYFICRLVRARVAKSLTASYRAQKVRKFEEDDCDYIVNNALDALQGRAAKK